MKLQIDNVKSNTDPAVDHCQLIRINDLPPVLLEPKEVLRLIDSMIYNLKLSGYVYENNMGGLRLCTQ